MSKRVESDLFNDIQEAISRIADYTAGMTYETFLADIKTQDAVIRNLEIIGEATQNLSERLRIKNPHIPWKNMSSVRDRLIHHYFGVNLDIVWQIVTVELPEVASELYKISGVDLS